MSGKVKIENGSIIVTNSIDSGKFPSITPASVGTLYVNGTVKKGKTIVREGDDIVYDLHNEEGCRELNIIISNDKMQAFASVKINPGKKYTMVDSEEAEHIDIILDEDVLETPALFSEKEIYEKLKLHNISIGIDVEAVKKIAKSYNLDNLLIAQGEVAINAEDDSIKFFVGNDDNIVDDNSMESIDYKNINRINSVNEGEVIAEITRGFDSKKGTNIHGVTVYAKRNIRKEISSGKGCTIKDDKVIALKGGQVSYRNNIVSINDAYNINSDVDIKTGNIKFPGDVNILGSISDGMTVFALNNLNVGKSVYSSNVVALGDINIKNNVINSKVVAGGEDVASYERIGKLNKLKEVLENLVQAISYLETKSVNINQGLGVIAKTLMDTKFKDMVKICNDVMISAIKAKDNKSQVLCFIREKLMGNNVLNVEDKSEFIEAIEIIDEEITALEAESGSSSSITLEYCQESEINASGDVFIKGKGVFSTEITSLSTVTFLDKSSVCRGGKIKAKNLIKATIVGNESDVTTILEVEDKKGEIFIDVAYNNTVITIGNKSKTINKPSRNVHCYIDKSNQLTIDKFVL